MVAVPEFDETRAGNHVPMIRKLLWTGLYAGLGAAATVGARTVASRVWRIATGEQPPAKK
jgi:hypothetical protein